MSDQTASPKELPTPRFAVGEQVRVKRMDSAGHTRTPAYLMGQTGTVVRLQGGYRRPEDLAYGEMDGTLAHVYMVRFAQHTLWEDYTGAAHDAVLADIFEYWLDERMSEDRHNPYAHPPGHDGPPVAFAQELLERAIRELLVEKQVIDDDALRRSAQLQGQLQSAQGARLVARCWRDPAFKTLALQDTRAAAAQLGISVGLYDLVMLENRADVHHVVCCTLCSCFHSAMLGPAPSWYKGREYRSLIALEPRRVLAQFGVQLSPQTEIRVVDSTAEIRYMVLPHLPESFAQLSEEELIPLVRQEHMIGVALLTSPTPHLPR